MVTKKTVVTILLSIVVIAGALYAYQQNNGDSPPQTTTDSVQSDDAAQPLNLQADVVVEGLTKPWDVGFIDEDTFIFSEKAGTIRLFDNGEVRELLRIDNVLNRGEGGLMGLAVDTDFSNNPFIYACYNTADDIRVSRWTVQDELILAEQNDIVTGLPNNTTTFPGRHSGCRPRMDKDGVLWIGTGDVAIGTYPQDPTSLGGKVLRVDRDGNAADGNLNELYDPRIYSFGHRNIQGLAFAKSEAGFIGISVEHGPDVDDEINLLRSGNHGWDPVPGYDETVPMTDTDKYPNALEAIWSSGDPTLAPSGATFVYGEEWGDLDGSLLVAMLKTKHIRAFQISDNFDITSEEELFKDVYGRVRSVVQAPDGSIYFTTDNANENDVIVRVTPQ